MNTRDNVPPDSEIWLLMRTTWFAVSRLLTLDLARYGLTPEQASILAIISQKRSVTVRELEDITMRQHNSLTILVNRMARAGLLQRQKQPGRKGYAISLTPAGQTLAGSVEARAIDDVFSVLSTDQRRRFAGALEPLFQKSRDLLVTSSNPPFVQFLKNLSAPPADAPANGDELTARELWDLFNRAGFAGSRLRELELAPLGVTPMQSLVLKILLDNGGATSTRVIEDITLRQHHSISTLVDRMARMKLVSRRKSPRGRRHVITATLRGRELYARMTTYAIEMTLGTLLETQKRDLADCLASILKQARELLGVCPA